MTYTDEEFYTKKYLCGRSAVLDAADFLFYARQASMKIKQATFGNIDENKVIPEEVQMCCCEVAELLCKTDQRNNDHEGKVSEKTGDYSVSFVDAEKEKSMLNRSVCAAIERNLCSTGLLFSGIRRHR